MSDTLQKHAVWFSAYQSVMNQTGDVDKACEEADKAVEEIH